MTQDLFSKFPERLDAAALCPSKPLVQLDFRLFIFHAEDDPQRFLQATSTVKFRAPYRYEFQFLPLRFSKVGVCLSNGELGVLYCGGYGFLFFIAPDGPAPAPFRFFFFLPSFLPETEPDPVQFFHRPLHDVERVNTPFGVFAEVLYAVPYPSRSIAGDQLYPPATLLAKFHEEEAEDFLAVPFACPYDLACVVVHDYRYVRLPFAVAGFVYADIFETIQWAGLVFCGPFPDPTYDFAHGGP